MSLKHRIFTISSLIYIIFSTLVAGAAEESTSSSSSQRLPMKFLCLERQSLISEALQAHIIRDLVPMTYEYSFDGDDVADGVMIGETICPFESLATKACSSLLARLETPQLVEILGHTLLHASQHEKIKSMNLIDQDKQYFASLLAIERLMRRALNAVQIGSEKTAQQTTWRAARAAGVVPRKRAREIAWKAVEQAALAGDFPSANADFCTVSYVAAANTDWSIAWDHTAAKRLQAAEISAKQAAEDGAKKALLAGAPLEDVARATYVGAERAVLTHLIKNAAALWEFEYGTVMSRLENPSRVLREAPYRVIFTEDRRKNSYLMSILPILDAAERSFDEAQAAERKQRREQAMEREHATLLEFAALTELND